MFLSQWNGISMLLPPQPQHILESDALGSWSCAAIWRSEWFQLQWPPSLESANIAPKEMISTVLATAVWGKHWSGSTVHCACDNEAVVAMINSS